MSNILEASTETLNITLYLLAMDLIHNDDMSRNETKMATIVGGPL